MPKIEFLILGAGPTGLGAARRLEELNFQNWLLLEATSGPGGLATSFVDSQGFTWDIGGHVQFSHYEYFDNAMESFLGKDGWLQHQRESWVWLRDRFVPYPFQNNIHRLPDGDLEACLAGLVDITREKAAQPKTFHDWILANFGQGIADVFMFPYNYKVWAFPPEMMNATWVGERVAMTDLKRVLRNLVHRADDLSWGPNNTFGFPMKGGTGAIWNSCAAQLPQAQLRYGEAAMQIDLTKHEVTTNQGRKYRYQTLISTIPLRQTITISGQTQFLEVAERGLLYSSSNIFGIGLMGQPPEHLRTKCWMYFPESNCPFYRVTVFSNYSPHNVPDIKTQWSLMAEVSESKFKFVDHSRIEEEVISGLLATRLIERREDVISFWKYRAPYGYPTPGLHRDIALDEIIPYFEEHSVYSRGRFGLWKYEVSNQDHSFMQGVEIADRLINGTPEMTARDANYTNSKKHPWPSGT